MARQAMVMQCSNHPFVRGRFDFFLAFAFFGLGVGADARAAVAFAAGFALQYLHSSGETHRRSTRLQVMQGRSRFSATDCAGFAWQVLHSSGAVHMIIVSPQFRQGRSFFTAAAVISITNFIIKVRIERASLINKLQYLVRFVNRYAVRLYFR